MDNSSPHSGVAPLSPDTRPLNQWIFETIKPYIRGRTLEINGGELSLCSLFIESNRSLHLSDTNVVNLQYLKDHYNGIHLVRKVHNFDFTSPHFQQSYPKSLEVFDNVIAMKVTIADFYKFADNIKYCLAQGGVLVMILPAYNYIYSGLEENLEDWKRYNGKVTRQILSFGFSIIKIRYFNLELDKEKNGFAHSGLSTLAIFRKT
jgi:hypothetical protein